jgi:hypothetical protein
MTTSGWEQFNCHYFAEACRTAVGDYLQTNGFSESGLTHGGGIIYNRFDVFLEFNYDINLYPKYTVTALLGIKGGFSIVPMWYAVAKDHPNRTRIHWTFSSKEELLRILGEVKTEFLETTLVPLIFDRDGLERLTEEFRSEFLR